MYKNSFFKSSLNFYNAKNFNFGLYNPLEFDINLGNGKYHHFKDIYIIGNTFKDAYNEFHKVFNSYETTPFNYVLDEYKPLKVPQTNHNTLNNIELPIVNVVEPGNVINDIAN